MLGCFGNTQKCFFFREDYGIYGSLLSSVLAVADMEACSFKVKGQTKKAMAGLKQNNWTIFLLDPLHGYIHKAQE